MENMEFTMSIISSLVAGGALLFIRILWSAHEKTAQKALELERLLRERDEENKAQIAELDKKLSEAVGKLELANEKNKNYGAICSNFKHVNSKL